MDVEKRYDLKQIAREAIAAAGGAPVVARELGITKCAPYLWDRIPPKRLGYFIEKLGRSATELRPDLFPPASSTQESVEVAA